MIAASDSNQNLSTKRDGRTYSSYTYLDNYNLLLCKSFGLLLSWAVLYNAPKLIYTANALYQEFETNIPRNETARPRSQFIHTVSI